RSPNAALQQLLGDLETTIDDAKTTQQRLADRWNLWQQVVSELDGATVQLDPLRRPLESPESKPPQDLAVAKEDAVALKVSMLSHTHMHVYWNYVHCYVQEAVEHLSELKPTMQRLQQLSEALDPLESAYSNVRFFQVDVEQTQQL